MTAASTRRTTPADVRVFLAQHNVTQEELATRLGRSLSTVQRWCQPDGRPPPEEWRALRDLGRELSGQ